METFLQRVKSLDNIQLRAELLMHGEKVGPITPTTRQLFVSRLAKKLFENERLICQVDATSVCVGKDALSLVDANCSQNSLAFDQTATPIVNENNMTGSGEVLGESKQTGYNDDNEISAQATYFIVSNLVNNNQTEGYRIFTEKLEALAFMKKNAGARLKILHSKSDVKQFCSHLTQSIHDQKQEDISTSSSLDCEKSAFKGPKIQELVQFRKLIEEGKLEDIKEKIWNNPRYLISGADTPVILHEGMRHNALHIAAKTNQAAVARIVLETVHNPEFTKRLYRDSYDTDDSRQRRINFLIDLYLNSPDKGAGESPLHIACKMGFPRVVHTLVLYSSTDRFLPNKFGEKPEDIVCTRCKGNLSSGVKEEIIELLKGLCVVPLLRSHDNATAPFIGQPCSPDDKMNTCGSVIYKTQIPKEPSLTVSAFAGPMSPSKARDFHMHWTKPWCLRNSLAAEVSARREDAEKGFERIGRKLARELHVPWTEYWEFLDAFADFSTFLDLHKLELHLKKQQALQSVQMSMLDSSSDDSESDSGDSSEEYFSCDEDSNEQEIKKYASCDKDLDKRENKDNACACTPTLKCVMTDTLIHNSQGDAAFEDSLGPEDFYNTCNSLAPNHMSYLSGQKILDKSDNKEHTIKFTMDSTAASRKDSETKNTNLDKSFNSLMTELSKEFTSKLTLFSSPREVVKPPQRFSCPDIGICISKNLSAQGFQWIEEHETLDIMIKCADDHSNILADVVICSRKNSLQMTDKNTEIGHYYSHFSSSTTESIFLDVKVITKTATVFEQLQRLSGPSSEFVGILEEDQVELNSCNQEVLARVVRQKKKFQNLPCYIYGSQQSKTDLDVLRAIRETDVDRFKFPLVFSWLHLVTKKQQEEPASSWPSPAKLQRQRYLSLLQAQANTDNTYSFSPLVQDCRGTSTPVARRFPSEICNNKTSEQPCVNILPRTLHF